MEWQPIETAPRDGRILVYCPKYGEQFVAFLGVNPNDGEEKWVIAQGSDITFIVPSPTHWMPLPPPPSVTTSVTYAGEITENGVLRQEPWGME